jgi:Cu(I)/Ag(I) efflux system protein CusF
MKFSHILLAGQLVLAAPALAQSMAHMPGMGDTGVKTGRGTGIVTALDRKAATITIKHGSIPAVGWPAMTMSFKATPPALLNKVKVGQTIGFDVRTIGMNAEVTAIRAR